MRRVLYMVASAQPGGAERATMLMLKAHDRSRYEPGVLFFDDGPLVEDARALGLRVETLTRRVRLSRPLSVRAAVAASRQLIASAGYDLVHTCMAYAHLI